MKQYPRGGLIGRCVSYAQRISAMQISNHASHACYFIVLALFPTLTLLIGLLRYTALEPAALMELAERVLPAALAPYGWRLITAVYGNTSRMVVSVSAVAACWSAGRGLYGLLTGLNSVYGVEETRSWLHTRAMCMLYTVLFLLVLLLTLVLHVFGSTITAWIRTAGNPRLLWWLDLIDMGFFVVVAAQTLLFSVMFMFLPCKHNGFRESLPGALFGSLGWMAFSALFSVYVENFAGYTTVYGSVYAVALAMLWLYMCVCIVFYGGALNRFLMDRRENVSKK